MGNSVSKAQPVDGAANRQLRPRISGAIALHYRPCRRAGCPANVLHILSLRRHSASRRSASQYIPGDQRMTELQGGIPRPDPNGHCAQSLAAETGVPLHHLPAPVRRVRSLCEVAAAITRICVSRITAPFQMGPTLFWSVPRKQLSRTSAIRESTPVRCRPRERTNRPHERHSLAMR